MSIPLEQAKDKFSVDLVAVHEMALQFDDCRQKGQDLPSENIRLFKDLFREMVECAEVIAENDDDYAAAASLYERIVSFRSRFKNLPFDWNESAMGKLKQYRQFAEGTVTFDDLKNFPEA